MPQTTTIRQRILNQAKLICEGISGIGTVRFWDSRGTITYASGDCIIAPQNEDKADIAIGNPGTIESKLSILVAVVIFDRETDTDPSSTTINTWVGKIANAFLANRFFTETTGGVRLAIDSMPFETTSPDLVDGAIVAAVRVEATYYHDGDNVFSGPGITQV